MSKNDIRISTIRKITREAKKRNKRSLQLNVQKQYDQLRTELNASIKAAAKRGYNSAHLRKECFIHDDEISMVYALLAKHYENAGYNTEIREFGGFIILNISWEKAGTKEFNEKLASMDNDGDENISTRNLLIIQRDTLTLLDRMITIGEKILKGL